MAILRFVTLFILIIGSVWAEENVLLMNPTLKGSRMSASSGLELKGICIAKGFSDFVGDSVVFSEKDSPAVVVDEVGDVVNTTKAKYVTRINCVK